MKSVVNTRIYLRHKVICIPTFDRAESICDFVFQTARDLALQNVVIILALGENWQGRSGWEKWIEQLQLIGKFGSTETSSQYINIGLFHFIPFQRCQKLNTLNQRLNLFLLNLVISYRMKKRNKILWIFHPDDSQVISVFQLFGWSVHHDIVDWHTSCFPQRQLTIDARRDYLLRTAKSMTALSERVIEKIHHQTEKEIGLVPQGFDAAGLYKNVRIPLRLARILKTLSKTQPPIVGYFGAVSTRIDITVLANVVLSSPQLHFLFVGPRQIDESATVSKVLEKELDELLKLPNVTYYSTVPRGCLLEVMKHCAALLLPYNLDYEFNRCCFPMKIMEYFAAGKPIVSSAIPSLKKYHKIIRFADSSKSYCRQLVQAVSLPLSAEQLLSAREIVRSQTWTAKLDSVDVYLQKMLGSP